MKSGIYDVSVNILVPPSVENDVKRQDAGFLANFF